MARGRRVNSSGERSKQLLLEKAVELFSTHGYHQTKISDIVKAANLTQPTFYLYFQSKETLFNDLNEKFQSELFRIFSRDLAEATYDIHELENVIQEKLKRIFVYFIENPKLTKIGFYESEQAMTVKEMLVNEMIIDIEMKKTRFEELNRVDARTFAESLLGSIERLTLTNLLTNKTNPATLAEDIVAIYFAQQRNLVV